LRQTETLRLGNNYKRFLRVAWLLRQSISA